LQNLYSQFELPKLWGTGASAAADGTHFETFKNNLLAARHFRYGKTGGIAYRHISDNYIALFSRFIGCGIYEATYILDILQTTLSDFRPTRLHADSHGQSAHVFGLAFLLGIELMPRIRGWKKLKLFRPGTIEPLDSIKHLFTATINWRRIEEHYPAFMRLALAIHSGKLCTLSRACANQQPQQPRSVLHGASRIGTCRTHRIPVALDSGRESASRGAQGHDEGRAQPSVREILEFRLRGRAED
jgi:TnpA family transposase